MVESTPLIIEGTFRTVPDASNFHRTLNPSHPYNRKRRPHPKGLAAITDAESGLGDEKVVLMCRANPENCVKLIEPNGHSYQTLKQKYAILAERMQKGASAHFENESSDGDKKEGNKSGSDDQDDEDVKDDGNHESTEKKKKKRTKAEVEQEALDGNLYGALEMYDVTYEADEKMITKAYRKMALKYHPDKLGANLTDRDKEIWLVI